MRALNAREIRQLAWADLAAGQFWPFVGGFFAIAAISFLICIVGVVVMVAAVLPSFQDAGSLRQFYETLLTNRRALAAIGVASIVNTVLLLYLIGFSNWGTTRMSLSAANRELRLDQCLSGWGHGWRMCWTVLVQLTYIQLWSLLLIVPGVIKLFSYAMTYFVQIEHPDWGADRCITESRRLMDGNRWRFFCLNLSFIGWGILCGLAAALVPLGGSLLQYLLMPYILTAHARFYAVIRQEKDRANDTTEI